MSTFARRLFFILTFTFALDELGIRKFRTSLLVTVSLVSDLLSNHDAPKTRVRNTGSNRRHSPLLLRPSSFHWSPSTRHSRFSIEPVNSRWGGLNSLTDPHRTRLRPDDEVFWGKNCEYFFENSSVEYMYLYMCIYVSSRSPLFYRESHLRPSSLVFIERLPSLPLIIYV